jgi:hypothetical protein
VSGNKSDRPRTGNGRTGGVKPTTVGTLQQRTGGWNDRPTPTQPPGWGIARVVNLFKR